MNAEESKKTAGLVRADKHECSWAEEGWSIEHTFGPGPDDGAWWVVYALADGYALRTPIRSFRCPFCMGVLE